MKTTGLFVLRLILAAFSGLLCYGSFQPSGLWPLSIAGAALLWVALSPWGRNKPSLPWLVTGALLAFVQSMVMYLLLLPWIGELVGTLPYVALSVTESLYALIVGFFGAALARRQVPGAIGFAFLWAAVEWLRSTWPFGGFAWGRLAWGQVDSPLKQIATLGGPALVSFAVVLLGACAASMLLTHSVKGIVVNVTALFVPLVLLIINVGVNPPSINDSSPRVTVAAVQGNVPRLGLDFAAQRKAVLNNHVNQTINGHNRPVDMVIWPENSSDVNPFADDSAMQAITSAVRSVNAPILVGTLTKDHVGSRNTMVVIDPATGPGDIHNKKYLQPFGEWMPYRDLLRHVSPYVDLANDFKPGQGDGIVHMRAALTGNMVTVGVATCYEVVFDKAGRDAVKHGAEFLAVPTNNATFGFSDMTWQQLAMSRMRGIELDRYVVVAATSGVSAIVDNNGKVLDSSKIFTPATLTRDIALSTRLTTAARFGNAIEALIAMMGGIAAAVAFATRPKPPSRGRNRKKD
ncbi:apolipoprotein N-acyltransferase [Corynebacterium sp. CCM 8862]|uniref:Apolipoprotein N-acyltransferase n=1 Tax=Corynebacterium mendelii TaxID=2765362 RepID=A0A939IT70_9CORY|nr:apolipoprotein N-acyltransferase [Corynebacterium mendelii]